MNTRKHLNKHDIFAFLYRDASKNIFAIVMLLTKQLGLWRQKSRQRKDLARLTDQQLHDLGISREEANAEASQVFWK